MKIAPVFIIILMISLSECLGQSCLKKLFKEPSKTHLFLVAVVFYALVCYLLVLSYQYKGMGIVNVLWSGMSVLLMVSVGLLFYKEELSSNEISGIILIIIGMILTGWNTNREEFYNFVGDKLL